MSKVLVNKNLSYKFTQNRTEINQNFQCAMIEHLCCKDKGFIQIHFRTIKAHRIFPINIDY